MNPLRRLRHAYEYPFHRNRVERDLDDRSRESEVGRYGFLFLTLGAIALLIASAGLYAVLAHAVSQSTQEIGARLALGGTPGAVLGWVITVDHCGPVLNAIRDCAGGIGVEL
jgi:hypothetical protein